MEFLYYSYSRNPTGREFFVPARTLGVKLLMVSFQRWAGSADEDIDLFLVGGKNYSWHLHEGHDGEIDGLGSKIGPKPRPGYQMKAHIKGFRLV